MIRIPAGSWEAVARHCVDAAPEEAVGYLAAVRGAEEDVTDAITVMNMAEDAHVRYEVAEHEQLVVWALLEEQHKRPVVTYHSHVNAPARLSTVDVEMARDSRMLHLIVSIYPEVSAYGGIVDLALFRVEYAHGLPVVSGRMPFRIGDVDYV